MRQTIIFTLAWVLTASAYAQQGGNVIDVDLQDTETEQVSAEPVAQPDNKVYILNQNSNNNANANDNLLNNQPTTYVEASPLVESRADQIRRARKEAEVQTEVKIVEKLESSRLEDERRRSERLFGDRWSTLNESTTTATAVASDGSAATANAQTVQVVPVAPVQAVDPEEDRRALKEEILSEVARTQMKAEVEEVKSEEKKSYYMSGYLGSAEYPEANNVESDIAAGASLGFEKGRMMIEGAFLYSRAYIQDSYWAGRYGIWTKMDQYDLQLAAKYALLDTTVKPLVGVVGSYTHRKYTDPSYRARQHYGNYNDATSNSIDMGFVLGLDFEVSESFTIGADFRYLFNLTASNDHEYLNSRYRYRQDEAPIESLDHYLLTVGAKFRF